MFAVLVVCLSYTVCIQAIERVFYIGMVEEEWDYAPKGNVIYNGDPGVTDMYLKLDKEIPLLGTKYKKALYRQFTDSSFSKQVQAPEWQGVIGPLMRAEIGDTIIVHFQNQARFNYSIHPHGVFYNKNSEGAEYSDGSAGRNKLDDAVPPGQNYTYIWSVRPEYGPMEDDPSCITWLYHSHQDAEVEQMSGAVGILATCKKGTLDKDGNRRDIDKDISLLITVMDENFSHYLQDNMKAAGITQEAVDRNFHDFREGNLKHSINGYIYGNLPGLDFCVGDKVNIHLATIGNDFDHHVVYIQGQTMEIYKQRTNVGVYPGSSLTAVIDVDNEGKWLMTCKSLDNIQAGMQAYFNVRNCNKDSKRFNEIKQLRNNIRTYYVAAEEVIWNYAPMGIDKKTGQQLTEYAPFTFNAANDSCFLNGIYKKAVFKGYRDSQFKLPLERSDTEMHLGYLGPVIRAEVGDTIKVHFINRASRPYSIQADRYYGSEKQQGIQFNGSKKVAVAPNETREYTWTVPASAGPLEDDADCIFGTYYSAVDQFKDVPSGLVGPLLICKQFKLHAFENKLEKHFYLIFQDVQEKLSHYWEENLQRACGNQRNLSALQKDNINFQFTNHANVMNSINGYMYGNLPGLKMKQGEAISWFITSTGFAVEDQHSPYFHGNTFYVDGSRKDTVTVSPGLSKTLYMRPDNPGNWLIQDVIQFRGVGNGVGLTALYIVDKNLDNVCLKKKDGEKIRTYYIGAVEEEWNYFPDIEYNPISGLKLDEDPAAEHYYVQGNYTIGHIFMKALYREFTDETFETQKVRTQRDLHLGTLGPVIKAEVGDLIRVVFKNFARYSFSIQPHGVFYNKSNEGQSYKDEIHSSNNYSGDAVAPGEQYTYEWNIPARAGPTADDFPCIHWPYVSAVDLYSDLQAGLTGIIVICRQGVLDENNTRIDVDREFALHFNIFDETDSSYIVQNILKFTNKPQEVMKMYKEQDHQWKAGNFKMTINGYSFGSIRHVDMYLGETAAFYLMGLGDIFQMHNVHWHGNTFIRRLAGRDHRHDVIDVLAGEYNQVELIGVNAGEWLVHCHVNNHSIKGMLMTYRVIDPDVALRSFNNAYH